MYTSMFPQNVLKNKNENENENENENQYKTKKAPPSGRGLIESLFGSGLFQETYLD